MRKFNRELGTDIRQLERKEKELVSSANVNLQVVFLLGSRDQEAREGWSEGGLRSACEATCPVEKCKGEEYRDECQHHLGWSQDSVSSMRCSVVFSHERLTGNTRHFRTMASMNTMATAIGSSTQAMKAVDKAMPMDKFAQTMREFNMANDRMDMRTEVIDETLDSMLEVDEGEEDKIINQVLDEIGIETKAQVRTRSVCSGM